METSHPGLHGLEKQQSESLGFRGHVWYLEILSALLDEEVNANLEVDI
jgi:hypothetical protein